VFTFWAETTKCLKHNNGTVMDASCKRVPGVQLANPIDSWAIAFF